MALLLGHAKTHTVLQLGLSHLCLCIFRKSTMASKRRRDDKRRKIDGPATYEVEKLVAFRERQVMTRSKATGRFTVPKNILEYSVRWAGEWNNPKYDCWTKKENINEECIREFDGDVMTVTERLATVPAGLHPSHPGYASAMRMSIMAAQVKVIQHRFGPKKKIHHKCRRPLP